MEGINNKTLKVMLGPENIARELIESRNRKQELLLSYIKNLSKDKVELINVGSHNAVKLNLELDSLNERMKWSLEDLDRAVTLMISLEHYRMTSKKEMVDVPKPSRLKAAKIWFITHAIIFILLNAIFHFVEGRFLNTEAILFYWIFCILMRVLMPHNLATKKK